MKTTPTKNTHTRFPSFWPRVFLLRRFLFSLSLSLLGLSLLFFSLFAPQGDETERVLFVLDTSLSMSVEDISFSGTLTKSRLDLAKDIIRETLEKYKTSYGLITYARSASMSMPFSSDIWVFLDTLGGIEPTLVYGWSDISAALELVRIIYLGSSEPLHIVLLSDGGMTGDWKLADLPSNSSLTVIGIGTPAWGTIPLGYNLDGERRYKYYEWSPVIARYESENMEKLSHFYRAPLFHRETYDTSLSLPHLSYSSLSIHLMRIFWFIALLLSYMIRPYAVKK